MTSIQDRPAFETFNRIIQDLYNGGRKNKFYANGYKGGEDDGTTAINTFTGGKILDWLMIDSCISLHKNLTPERVTVDGQR